MIKKVGNTLINAKHRATCHCGAVELELDLPTASSIRAAAIARYAGAKARLWHRSRFRE
ncbi:hypothetical protein [Methylomonas fluvii]|uniref:hypothetical protein n=1 Tax=Methylomonas fluvii TaxID=1854564 RepID=UPI001CAA847A|nr:hypothetical protein [Methylomonas fluvii]